MNQERFNERVRDYKDGAKHYNEHTLALKIVLALENTEEHLDEYQATAQGYAYELEERLDN